MPFKEDEIRRSIKEDECCLSRSIRKPIKTTGKVKPLAGMQATAEQREQMAVEKTLREKCVPDVVNGVRTWRF